eukprot:UN32019
MGDDKQDDAKLYPWLIFDPENQRIRAELETRILKLSEIEETFLVNAPDETVYQFKLEDLLPFAKAALNADSKLKDQRYKLVPSKIEEEPFWRNYFYRISLVRKQLDVLPLTKELLLKNEPTPNETKKESQ